MFYNAYAFNGDISSWDVSNVTDMNAMFQEANSFNQNIGGWNVFNVGTMWSMFVGADLFDQDLSDWDISNVTNMDEMFSGADDLSDENKCAIHTSFSTNGNWLYDWSESCGPFQPQTTAELQTAVDLWVSGDTLTYGEINTWDVSLITNMSELFKDKTNFNDDMSNWDVSNVTNMSQMFRDATDFNGDISS
jgi:surface protein